MTGTINFWGPDGKPDEVNGLVAARVGLELTPSEKSAFSKTQSTTFT